MRRETRKTMRMMRMRKIDSALGREMRGTDRKAGGVTTARDAGPAHRSAKGTRFYKVLLLDY